MLKPSHITDSKQGLNQNDNECSSSESVPRNATFRDNLQENETSGIQDYSRSSLHETSQQNACNSISIEISKGSKIFDSSPRGTNTSGPEDRLKYKSATHGYCANDAISNESPETTQQLSQQLPSRFPEITELNASSLINSPGHNESSNNHENRDLENVQHIITSTVGEVSAPATVMEQVRGDSELRAEVPPTCIGFPMPFPEQSPIFMIGVQCDGGYLKPAAWDVPPTYEEAIGLPYMRPVFPKPASTLYQQRLRQMSSRRERSARNCLNNHRKIIIIVFVCAVLGFCVILYCSLRY